MAQTDRAAYAISPPPFPVTLDCPPVTLRRFSGADAECLVNAGRDPGILAYTSLDQMTTAEEVEHWLARREAEETAGDSLTLAVDQGGVAVGAVLLLHHDLAAATAEVGYWLLPQARGQGLASTALRALREWCIGAGYRRVSLVANLDNVATHRVARRCGFQAEGVLRSYDFDRSGLREDVVGFAYVAPGDEAVR